MFIEAGKTLRMSSYDPNQVDGELTKYGRRAMRHALELVCDIGKIKITPYTIKIRYSMLGVCILKYCSPDAMFVVLGQCRIYYNYRKDGSHRHWIEFGSGLSIVVKRKKLADQQFRRMIKVTSNNHRHVYTNTTGLYLSFQEDKIGISMRGDREYVLSIYEFLLGVPNWCSSNIHWFIQRYLAGKKRGF